MAIATIKNGRTIVEGRFAIIPTTAEMWLRNQPVGTQAFVKDACVIFGELVHMGEQHTRTGWRQCVIVPNGGFAPFGPPIASGYRSERCTTQIMSTDDQIRLVINWGHGDDGMTIMEVTEEGQKPYDFRVEIQPEVVEFLKPYSEYPW